MAQITQIIPCSDWFYYMEFIDSYVFEPVAAWALLADGTVVGLINEGMEGGAKLAPASANGELGGEYLHASQLDEKQQGWAGIKSS